MRKIAGLASVVILAVSFVQAQDYVAPGSTPQGDIMRREGQFLKGAAWYELNAAKAREIDAKTAKMLYDWDKQFYDDQQRERATRFQRHVNMTKAQAEAAKKKYEERETRLRTSPNNDDIIKGDALNALLTDLSDPAIHPSAWRTAQVKLRENLSIPSLVFRFAPKTGMKGSQELGQGVIALARLDTIKGNRWSRVLSSAGLASERKAYEAAYSKVCDECLAGNLSLETPIVLNEKIVTLKDKVNKVVPAANGYRAAASRAVDDLRNAAKIFHADTIDYAQEMIADTQRHDAKTVGELLAFMRKYRLLFASVERSPNGSEQYRELYRLMREQKEKLRDKDNPLPILDIAEKEHQKINGTWMFVSQNRDGKEIPRANWEQFRLKIENGTFTGMKGETFLEGGMRKLNPAKNPKEVDIIVTKGPNRGAVVLGIYEYDGDSMYVCQSLAGNPRPTSFEPGPGRQLNRFVRTKE